MAEGPNLVVNGTFPVNITNWTGLPIGFATFLHDMNDGGRAILSVFSHPAIQPASTVVAYQAITVTAFTDYKATWDIKIAGQDSTGPISYAARAGVGLTGTNPPAFDHGFIFATSTGIKTLEFTTGSETTVYMLFYCGVGSGAFEGANSFNFDDVTLREQLSGLFSPRILIL